MQDNKQAILEQAVQNAQLLLSYIAENGIEIQAEYVKILTKSKYISTENNWDADSESEFWLIYQKVSKLIKPANIDSLLATIEFPIENPNFIQRFLKRKKHLSPAHYAVKSYRTITYLSVAILLLLQIYSVIGTTVLRKIDQSTQRMNEIKLKITDLSMINRAVNQRTSVQIGSLQSEFDELEMEKNSSIELLDYWQKLEFLPFTGNDSIENSDKNMMNFGPGNNPSYVNRVNIIQSANNTHIILNSYILPLLYGLLGALAFVLRYLPNEIKSMQFSKESNINYTLRVTLGALLGLIVGLFWGDTNSVSTVFIANLPPLAVAFLAGYSVEFIFKLFDMLINLILKNNKKSEENKTVNKSFNS